MIQIRTRYKKMITFFIILVLLCAMFPVGTIASEQPAGLSLPEKAEEDKVYEITLGGNKDADIDDMIEEYASMFNGADIKLKLEGNSCDCLKFATSFEFASLELECSFSDYYSYDAQGNIYRLCDVIGLTKLTMPDNGYGFYSADDVFENLTDLTLINEDSFELVYGDISSSQMPALKHLTLMFENENDLHLSGMRLGMLFPKTLETIDIYFAGELADPGMITDGQLIGTLMYCCPDALVNGVSVSDLTAADEADVSAQDILEKAATGAVIMDILSGVRSGIITAVDEMPKVYGKLLFAFFDEYYDGRKTLVHTSASSTEKEWDYMALMSPEQQSGNQGNVYDNDMVPKENLAGGISDTDVLIIIYLDHIPVGESEAFEGENGELFRRDYNVIIADIGNNVVYAPYTAFSVEPGQEYDNTVSGVDVATEQVMQAYASGGSIQKTGLNPVADDNEDDKISYVLNALANQNYIDTFTALQSGETIVDGSYSMAAAGLQQTLVDLGCNIDVDGKAGPLTFSALNKVLSFFGMENAEEVDAELYAWLLSICLIAADADTARELLYDDYASESGSRFDYFRGCTLYAQEYYYQALEAFLASEYGDYKERAEQCVQEWPQNGEIWHNSDYYSKDMYLIFTVNSYDESEGMFFEVYTDSGILVSSLFQTGSGTVYTSLPGGLYRIKDASGKTWYGPGDAFGREGSYEFMSFYEIEDDPYLTYLESGYEWTITVNVTSSTAEGTGVGSVSSDWESWVGK